MLDFEAYSHSDIRVHRSLDNVAHVAEALALLWRKRMLEKGSMLAVLTPSTEYARALVSALQSLQGGVGSKELNEMPGKYGII